MKQALLIFFIVLGIGNTANAAKDGPVDLTGSWREVMRQNKGNEAISFDDTTFYDFMVGNEYTVQRKHSFMYRGSYKATSSFLDLGMRAYNVLSMSHDRMVLKDDAGKYEFRRYDKSALNREDNTAAASGQRANNAEVVGGYVDAAQLAGRWDVYKRTSSTPLEAVDYTHIVRSVTLKPSGGSLTGSVYAAKDMEGSPGWQVMRYEGGTLYCSGKTSRELKVIRCADGELILQEGVITYFFKQFK